MVLVCDGHDLRDLLAGALDVVVPEDAVVLLGGEEPVLVRVGLLKEPDETSLTCHCRSERQSSGVLVFCKGQ